MFTKTHTLTRTDYLATTGFLFATLALALFATPALANHNPDTNNDGYISVAEGVPFYGAIAASLTTTGDTSPTSALALDRFPTADENGDYTYSRTITVSDEQLADLDEAHIIVHGIDIDDSNAYDGTKQSSIADGVPFEATVPAACGLFKANGENYTVDLDELNSTGVDGDATVTVDGNELTITMTVEGAAADLPHAQHIHIGGTNQCPPNTAGVEQDEDEDEGIGYGNKFEKFQTRFDERQEKFQAKFETKREKFQNRFEARQEKFQQRFEDRSERFSNWW